VRDIAARLAALNGRWTCRITTRGRRTGKPHTVTIWFLADGERLYLGTMNAKRDWVRNVAKNPEVEFAIGDLTVHGRAHAITDPSREPPHVQAAFLRKYWIARVSSWLGLGPDRMFRVDDLAEGPCASRG
jgi:deazaflavin-dependent oxidoreductase (nitroreductase family)